MSNYRPQIAQPAPRSGCPSSNRSTKSTSRHCGDHASVQDCSRRCAQVGRDHDAMRKSAATVSACPLMKDCLPNCDTPITTAAFSRLACGGIRITRGTTMPASTLNCRRSTTIFSITSGSSSGPMRCTDFAGSMLPRSRANLCGAVLFFRPASSWQACRAPLEHGRCRFSR